MSNQTVHAINAALGTAASPHADFRHADALILGHKTEATGFNVGAVYVERVPGQLARIARVLTETGDIEYLSAAHADIAGVAETLLAGIKLGQSTKQAAAA
jgi:hypothetical protein